MSRKDSPPPRNLVFARARWKHFMRYVGAFILILLNFSMIMSTVHLHQLPRHINTGQELLSFLVVFIFDVTILLPILMEVDGVEISSDGVTFRTLAGRRRYRWQQIRAYHNPIYLNYVVIRTGYWVYLINKRDIDRIDELVQIIQSKLSVPVG